MKKLLVLAVLLVACGGSESKPPEPETCHDACVEAGFKDGRDCPNPGLTGLSFCQCLKGDFNIPECPTGF